MLLSSGPEFISYYLESIRVSKNNIMISYYDIILLCCGGV